MRPEKTSTATSVPWPARPDRPAGESKEIVMSTRTFLTKAAATTALTASLFGITAGVTAGTASARPMSEV